MNIKEKFINLIKRFCAQEPSARRLAMSCAAGIFIAFSPFIGFHTVMVLLSGWLFHLNIPIMFIISCGLNNPWTMVPIYWFDHYVGVKVLSWFLGPNLLCYEPAWMMWCSETIKKYTGLPGVSLWGFLIGGNLLGVIGAVLCYWIVRVCYKQYCKPQQAAK